MPRKPVWPPKPQKRRGREYLRVQTPSGERSIALGPAGSPEARQEYLRILAVMEANGRQLPLTARPGITVLELVIPWLERAQIEDEPRTRNRKRRAMKGLRDLYGSTPAEDFGPLSLRTLRDKWIREGLSRRYCNHLTDSVRQLFRWAVAEELIPVQIADRLDALTGLRRRGKKKSLEPLPVEKPRVRPVEVAIVERTLPHLTPVVRDLVRLLLATGMRPGEACALRPCDLEKDWRVINGVSVWLYKLDEHKNDWRGHLRWVPFAPRAQEILQPYLDREPEAYCFSPREARAAWEAGKRARRKTPAGQGNRPGTHRAAKPKRVPGPCYSTESVDRAIRRACDRHGIPRWAPNQIRHTVLTRVETEIGREDARCVGGHRSADTTAIYTEQVERAARAMAQLG